MKRTQDDQPIDREPMREPLRPQMKNRPNWERDRTEFGAGGGADRLHIDPSRVPADMALQWVTDSVLGQPQASHRSEFERNGWTPLTAGDFNGEFDGLMPRGAEGEIMVDGMALMARPKEMNDQAKVREEKAAKAQVDRNREFLTGDSALPSNRISKSYERIAIPES